MQILYLLLGLTVEINYLLRRGTKTWRGAEINRKKTFIYVSNTVLM